MPPSRDEGLLLPHLLADPFPAGPSTEELASDMDEARTEGCMEVPSPKQMVTRFYLILIVSNLSLYHVKLRS